MDEVKSNGDDEYSCELFKHRSSGHTCIVISTLYVYFTLLARAENSARVFVGISVKEQ